METQTVTEESQSESSEGSKTVEPVENESSILIVYFSRWGNTDYPDDVDATISASIIADGEIYGTTEYVARMIQKTVGGDITYCEAHHNMAIFYAQTDNPNLSVDVIPIGRVTSDLSLFNTLYNSEKITFSLAE